MTFKLALIPLLLLTACMHEKATIKGCTYIEPGTLDETQKKYNGKSLGSAIEEFAEEKNISKAEARTCFEK